MLVVYVPPFHWVFGGSHRLSPLYWLIPMAFGVLLLAWASMRVVLLRKSNERARARDIRGLMMCEYLLWIDLIPCCELTCGSGLTDPTLET
jgi:sodium/potassium-transporting ATPase subunit alpha